VAELFKSKDCFILTLFVPALALLIKSVAVVPALLRIPVR